MRLEFSCTACRRPGIARDTFASFAENLRGVDFRASRLYLNIDPVPTTAAWSEVVRAAHSVFGDVRSRLPDSPCFPAAVKWCWQQPGGEFFVHLEEDWLLRQPVEIGEMLALLQADPGLSVVNLRAYPHNDDRICLAPGLWRTAHAKAIAEKMRTDANPEMQLRRARPNNPHGDLHLGYRGMQYPAQIVLKDIGRAWMATMGLRREKGRSFVKWA